MDSQVTHFLGETIGFWIQTGAVTLSAIAAVLVIGHNGRMARRRATIDLIIGLEKDEEYNQKYASVSKLIKNNACLVNYADYIDQEHDDLENVRFVMNRLEFIAQGIRKNAFEEEIYKDLNYSNYLKLWNAVKPLIMEIRRINGNKETLFQEMEWLANRWQKSKNRIKPIN